MKAAIFDFGGVVFRWQPLELLQRVLPGRATDEDHARHVAAELFQGFVPGSDWAEFDLGRVSPGQLAERIAARTGFGLEEVAAVIAAIPPHLEAQPGTVELMRRLKAAGHRLFYLSNMPLPYAEHLERSHGFFEWFDGGLFSGRVQLIKPERAIFEQAQQHFGLEAAHCVFIDDVLVNVEAARACGWSAVHFTDAEACGPELQALGLSLA